jgi:hypothetical protein
MTERKASASAMTNTTAKAKEETDHYGLTARKAKATTATTMAAARRDEGR